MPRLTVWMLRLALLALLGGAVIGAALLGGLSAAQRHAGALRALHVDLMLFGWLVQSVLAVAYWILPRRSTLPERGPGVPAWVAFALFQMGVAAATLAPMAPTPSALLLLGRLLLVAATLLFLLLLIPRVKPFGTA